MIIKGKSIRGGGKRVATHLMRTDTNERAEVLEVRGVVAEDLRGALLEMEALAYGTRTQKPFYHSSINTLASEKLTDAQRLEAIERLEKALGLSGQARVVVLHVKEGREHCHIVWSRIDVERMAAISDSHNFRKHEEVARALEREFGHTRVQGAHVEREGKQRPERTPSHAEMLQADRTGMSTAEVKEKITELWRGTKTGQDFARALEDNGFVLARGDRRDFVVIDPAGGTHSLARRIEGATAKDVRARMADIDAGQLPNVREAKALQRERQGRTEGPEPSQTASAERPAAAHSREIPPHAASQDHGRSQDIPPISGVASRGADGMARGASAMFDGIASVFERGLSGEPSQSDQEKEAKPPEPQPTQDEINVRTDEEDRAKKRQELLRRMEDELGREQDTERGRDRDRDRSR